MPKRSWASAALALAALLAGCSDGGEGEGDPALTVYVSLPPVGDGRDAADGARIALAEAGDEAAGIPVRARFLDAWGKRGRWTPERSAANARAATQDSTAIAYLGDFESGAARASLPVTNDARLLQVSPASAAEDLVAVPGTDDLPEAQPDARTFGRVIPGDEEQARAGAGWTRELGFERVATESDGSAFGDAMVADYEEALGGSAILDQDSGGLLYYAGLPSAQPPTPAPAQTLMVTDAALAPGASAPAGVLATSAALDPAQLPPAGREFAERFEAEYGRRPGRFGAYGYEAMAVILDSIERAADPADRASVTEAFFETADRDSILGRYSVSELGETTLERMTGYELRSGGHPRPVAMLQGD